MFDLIEGKPKPNDLQLEYKERYFSEQVERAWGPNIGPRFIAKYQHLMDPNRVESVDLEPMWRFHEEESRNESQSQTR